MDPTYTVLFICTGNSARSILAEGLMKSLGATRGFKGYSAGSRPNVEVHPLDACAADRDSRPRVRQKHVGNIVAA